MASPIEPDADRLAAAKRRVLTLHSISGADLAVLLGVNQQTVSNAAAAGELPFESLRVGQRWVFPSLPIREFLGLTTDTPVPAA